MTATRRAFLGTLGGMVGAVVAAPLRSAPSSCFLTCGKDARGTYLVAGFAADGSTTFELPLPARGHAGAVHPSGGECIVFARRPGTFALVLDPSRGTVRHTLEAPEGRHYYGHGAYTADGRLLFASENDYITGTGVLGIYDVSNGYARISEVPSHGVGPHQIRLMPDGRTLLVANGGILTRPDTGRSKLNIDSMAPNLAFIDIDSRRLRDIVRLGPALHKLSIRHIDVNAAGTVAFAMQYEGDRRDDVPLIGVHAGGKTRMLRPPFAVERRLRHYTGSIAFDRGGRILAISSPRGHLVTFWAMEAGQFLGMAEAPDASGLAADDRDGTFLVTRGDGAIRRLDARTGAGTILRPADSAKAWDNHLTGISTA